ncbi:LuxR family transcriptional regulator [Sedimenticola hydrogenitrophicus]|uniref:LuxR family transcriptional regulator n=1 Tax=Sedimenticola hydrogenitrophicus TaxID=2967975 RepID=UPI0021A408AA|nr:LuxR family transcriptional regulator [Sedimenticola hydrogenitrophicus]
MVDMTNALEIIIWEGCDAGVSQAIKQFRDRWHPYSKYSRRYPVIRLVQELIDPALARYAAELSPHYLYHAPGLATEASFSEIIRLVGLDAMVTLQKELLRKFLRLTIDESDADRRFIATQESLIELVWSCACKRPAKSKVPEGGASLNAERYQSHCRFCGNQTEFASFIECGKWPSQDDENFSLALRLSSRYCSEHRPKHADGTWNPAYRRAKCSQDQFKLELERLNRQSAKPAKPQSRSGNRAIDLYILNHAARQTLQPADKAELRNQARQMADGKLSDRKKQIIMMLTSGHTQSEVARTLGISRQAVSKALTSIPSSYRLDELR